MAFFCIFYLEFFISKFMNKSLICDNIFHYKIFYSNYFLFKIGIPYSLVAVGKEITQRNYVVQ
jgi:hypothetical protein